MRVWCLNPEDLEVLHQLICGRRYVSRLVNNSTWENVLKEIEKCDVVCANCHKIRTIKQFGYCPWYTD